MKAAWLGVAIAATMLCGGCATAPSSSAAMVKESDQAGVAGCQFIGTIVGSSLIGGIVLTTGATNAMTDVKEQSAAKGATHVVFGDVDSGGLYSTGKAIGRAYRCAAAKVGS